MYVRTPRNETVLREFGSYPGHLNLLGRKATAVQRAIRRGGLAGYEPETMATLFTLVQQSRRPAEFFDVGAHIGVYSALVETVFPVDAVNVTAFEPAPHTAEITRDIIKRNHLTFRLEETAVGAEVGTATLFLSEVAETSNSLVAGFRPSSESVVVPKTTLDVYCREHEVEPTVIKIDVETYESFVLRGARETLAHARPSVVCELLPSFPVSTGSTISIGPETAETAATLATFDDFGYHVHRWVPDNGWQECESKVVLERSDDEVDIRDWLFTPEPLTPQFHEAHQEWLTAIAACGAETNLMVDSGHKPPRDWGTRHRLAPTD
jgi:FkbM family methyltransferase